MLKQTALTFFLLGLAFAQREYPVEVQLDDAGLLHGSKVKCIGGVPKDFACAILFDVEPPLPNGIDIASVVGGENNYWQSPPAIREISVILDGMLYTVVYDPPLKRDHKFSNLRENVGIPARVDGEDLFVKWDDGKEVKAKIIRREKIKSNRPQPS